MVENFGTYVVTVDADDEGRSSRNLGVYTGYIDEIAFYLANKHKILPPLEFRKIPDPTKFDKDVMVDRVAIHLYDIPENYKASGSDALMDYASDLFNGRPVNIQKATWYHSIWLENPSFNPEEAVRRKALAKLTPEEKEVLGLS